MAFIIIFYFLILPPRQICQMLKRFLTDPSFWLLLAMNLYSIYYYQDNPDGFKTIVWLYWSQSVLIGLFNFAYLLTIKRKASSQNANILGNPTKTAFFFLLHYGAFHFAYMIFIFATINKGRLDIHFLLFGVTTFLLSMIVDLVRKKMNKHSADININTAFFLPYLRIIPMHLMFLLPAFTGWKITSVFLILKTIADMAMYIVTRLIEEKKVRVMIAAKQY